MNPSIKERCEFLNIENNIFSYCEGMPSSIEIYYDMLELQYDKDKILLIRTILLPSIQQAMREIYPDLSIRYYVLPEMIQLDFYPTPRREEIFIDIIEHIINIIEIVYEDFNDIPEHTDIQYDRSRTFLRIH